MLGIQSKISRQQRSRKMWLIIRKSINCRTARDDRDNRIIRQGHWKISYKYAHYAYDLKKSMNVIKIEIEGIKRIKTSLDGIMYQSALAAITECYTLDGLNKRNLFSHNYGGWKSEMRCQHVWVLLRALFLDCDGYLLALCSHGLSLVCVHVCVCVFTRREKERGRDKGRDQALCWLFL